MDRNTKHPQHKLISMLSLSARRAWIEIASGSLSDTSEVVALRKESVDRNFLPLVLILPKIGSLSARRAWIEIFFSCSGYFRFSSLSARRAWIEIHVVLVVPSGCWRRSPQGERG